MTCGRYRRWQMGKLGEACFRAHAAGCDRCRKALAEDERLMAAARALRIPVEAENLWTRIQAALLQQAHRRPVTVRPFPVRRFVWAGAAAVLALALGISVWVTAVQNRSLLGPLPLAVVEKRENAYMQAIGRLEASADARLGECDVTVMLLYRERLRIIDEQIALCREALASNPANTGIRRYLFTALKQKREALDDILRFPDHTDTGKTQI